MDTDSTTNNDEGDKEESTLSDDACKLNEMIKSVQQSVGDKLNKSEIKSKINTKGKKKQPIIERVKSPGTCKLRSCDPECSCRSRGILF